MKMIVGLGNPGKKYEKTRHNIGFIVVEEIATSLVIQKTLNKFNAQVALASYQNQQVCLVKPQTFMNLSGEAVFSVASYYKIEPKDILVISDDMDLPVGKIRIRPFGGAGGQKGLQNIIDRLQTNQFPRLRVGIGKSPLIDAANYVLGKIDDQEKEAMIQAINIAKNAALLFVQDSIEQAMNTYNNSEKNGKSIQQDITTPSD